MTIIIYWFSAQDSVKPQLVSGVLNGQTLSLLQGAVVVVAQVHLLHSRIKHVCAGVNLGYTWVYCMPSKRPFNLMLKMPENFNFAWELQFAFLGSPRLRNCSNCLQLVPTGFHRNFLNIGQWQLHTIKSHHTQMDIKTECLYCISLSEGLGSIPWCVSTIIKN